MRASLPDLKLCAQCVRSLLVHTLFNSFATSAAAFARRMLTLVSINRSLESVDPRREKVFTHSGVMLTLEMEGGPVTSWPMMSVFFIQERECASDP